MADAKRGRPPQTGKMAVYSRIDRDAVEGLDTISKIMDPQPTRAQLIDRAVREFVERNRPKRERK